MPDPIEWDDQDECEFCHLIREVNGIVDCCMWGEMLASGNYTRQQIDEMMAEQNQLDAMWDGLADAASY